MTPATLLSDLMARGVEFQAHGDKLCFRPVYSVTANELDAIRQNKAQLLNLLRATPAFDVDSAPNAEPNPIVDTGNPKPVCRCGSTNWRDVLIHDGQSVRRDCGRCDKFIEFTIWHGKVLDIKASSR